MKIPKIITICLVACCLFTGSAFAQCGPGISVNVIGELDFCGSGIQANQGFVGDTIVYSAIIGISDGGCPTSGIQAFFTPPSGGTPIAIPLVLTSKNPGDSETVPCIFEYTISSDDLGQLDIDLSGGSDPTEPDEVRALVTASGTADTGDGNTDEANGAAVRTTTVIPVTPEILVTKEACPYSKVGDEIIYDITIQNVGDVDLDFTSVTDTLLDDGVVETALLDAGCATLLVGESCNFQVPYVVQPGDDAGPGTILVNVIDVTYTHTATGQTAVDDDDAVVTLLHPSFTLDIQCVEIVDGSALFEANFCNTGDVGLLVDPDDPDIGDPFPLPVPGDGECVTYFIQIPVVPGVCGAAEASKTISAQAAIIMPEGTPAECQLGNIIDPDPVEATATCIANVNPSFTAEKICLDTTPLDVADGFAAYQINFENTSTGDVPVELLFEIDDPAADGYFVVVGPFAPGESDSVIVQVPVSVQVGCPAPAILNSATVTGICVADGSRLEPQIVNADCPGPCADFTVEKTCITDGGLIDGELAEYGIVITNTGDVPLDLIIDDPSAEPPLVGVVILLNPGEMYETTVSRTVVCAEPGDYMIDNTVSVIAVAPDGTQIGPKEATAECPYNCGGAEGCTPGFWKNHPDCWCDSYTPGMLASDVFTALQDPNYVALGDDENKPKSDFDQDTLLDALKYRGGSDLAGSVRNMLRHATAALLNGCSADVYYPVSDLMVIDLVNYVLETEDPAMVQELHSILAGFNEDFPCPIDAHCIRHEVTPD